MRVARSLRRSGAREEGQGNVIFCIFNHVYIIANGQGVSNGIGHPRGEGEGGSESAG